MPEIKAKLVEGKMRCSREDCPHYRKSTFEQYDPSRCEIGGGAGYAPENICVAWYVKKAERMDVVFPQFVAMLDRVLGGSGYAAPDQVIAKFEAWLMRQGD